MKNQRVGGNCVIKLNSRCIRQWLSPLRWQAIKLIDPEILPNGQLWTHFSEMSIKIQMFSFAFNNIDWKLLAIWPRHHCVVVGWSVNYPDSKVYGINMWSNWGRQDLGGPHVGPMNFAIWVFQYIRSNNYVLWPTFVTVWCALSLFTEIS